MRKILVALLLTGCATAQAQPPPQYAQAGACSAGNFVSATSTTAAPTCAVPSGTGVSSISNSDGTLTISPTTGAAVASRPAITGDVSVPGASNASTLATVNSNVGTFGSATQASQVTVNGKGLVTAAANVTVTPAASSITGGQALTGANDTNVTLTLGGTPSTALLQPSSITAGWTGTLGVTRGGWGLGTLTAHGIALGEGTGTPAFAGPGSSAQLLIAQGVSADPTFNTMSGGASISSSGVVTILSAPTTALTGTLQAAQFPALTGDVTTTAGALATTLATVVTGATNTKITYNAKGLVTAGAAAQLASADFANQGTTTTVLHGNAAGNPSFGAVALGTDVSGTLQAAQFPALTGDVTTSAGSLATTLANSGVTAGTYGSPSVIPVITVDAKGRTTGVTTATNFLESRLASDLATTSTTLQNTTITFTVPVGWWIFEANLNFDNATGTNGVKIEHNFSGTVENSTKNFGPVITRGTSDSSVFQSGNPYWNSAIAITPVNTSTGGSGIWSRLVINVTVQGTYTLQFSNNINATTATLRAGSYVTMTPLP